MRTFKRIAAVTVFVLIGLAAWLGWLYASSTEDYPIAAHPAAALTPLVALVRSAAPASGDRVLVVLVFDGLSARSIASVPTPNFARLAAEGSHTGAMLPVYPTLSLPNHFSLTTGCYPERHGVVSNRFIDPELGLYEHEKGDAAWLLGCEPINVVAERQGIRSAILGWVGATRGRKALASIVDEYRPPLPSIAKRTARVLELLAESAAERPRLIVAYHNEPDTSLHVHGFAAEPAKAAMRAADAAVGQVLRALEQPGLRGHAALIVTSDHGMLDAKSHINVERILRNAEIDATIAGDGATAHVYLRDPSTRAAALAKLQGHAHVTAFTPEQPPAYAHLGQSKRMGDFVIQTKPGDYVFDRGLWPKNLRWAAMYGPEVLTGRRFAGMHGYPPDTPGVQSVFYAWGAGIAQGAKLDGMQAIDVHPTMAAWLGIAGGTPIDGQVRTELFPPVPTELPAAEAADVAH
ncbi:MAG TPA: alkaline phosphatase family protein [Polyangiales bacterium]|nr:alkaline phosphatase family protein [Polyangiales bacterium]